MFQIEISLKFTVNHGPVSSSNFFYFLSFLSFLSSQGGIKLGWQNSEQLADIGLLVRTIVRSFTSCGRSFVITYAASARMSQYFLSSSFAPHTCVVLIYLLSFLPEIKTHKLINLGHSLVSTDCDTNLNAQCVTFYSRGIEMYLCQVNCEPNKEFMNSNVKALINISYM